MEKKTLDFGRTFSEAMTIGLKNAPSIIAAILLFALTCWIPYINIGTYIALKLLPTKLAKGEVINPLGIFDSQYRRYMGEFLITAGLMTGPVFMGLLFGAIPGLVLLYTWSLTYYFIFDKGKNPIQALRASNDATYGSKWMIVLVKFVFSIASTLALALVTALFGAINLWSLAILVMIPLFIIIMSIGMAIDASIWNQLKDNAA